MSIFSNIINGKTPSYKIAEDKFHLAFLDIYPLVKGHVLVIPKQEIDYIFDMRINEYRKLWDFARQVAKAMDKVFDCQRIGVSIVGLEVPHTHIHLIPINQVSDMNFEKDKLSLSDEDFRGIANLIKSAI